MGNISQLEIAKQIASWRKQGLSWSIIGNNLGFNIEKCRSIYRRYESDITGEFSVLSILDKVPDTEIIRYNKIKETIGKFDRIEKESGYGWYFCISDLHAQFCDRQALKKAIVDAKNRKITKAIINGDSFQLDSLSKYNCPRDELIDLEINIVKDLFRVFASEFEVTYITQGNHDIRLNKEITKQVKNGLKRFVKEISAIKTCIDELKEEDGIENLLYTGGNELKLGNVIFCHPDYYRDIPGGTVFGMIDTYITEYKDLSAVIIGHTHYDIKRLYKGIGAFETGCMCFDPDYRLGAKKRKDIWTTAYGIFKINKKGNLEYNESHVIPILED